MDRSEDKLRMDHFQTARKYIIISIDRKPMSIVDARKVTGNLLYAQIYNRTSGDSSRYRSARITLRITDSG